jgi:phosphoserine phosphatase
MLAVFDVEGVLVDGEFLPTLANIVGKGKEVYEITLAGIRGEIKWEEGLKRRIQLIRGLEYDECIKVANRLPLMKGARELFKELKALGYKTMAVSGGPSILVNRVKKELGLDYALSNILIFRKGRLEDVEIRVTSNKVDALKELIYALGWNDKKIVAIVDGANDLKLFEIAKLRIAFNAQPIVKSRADIVIDEKDLTELIPIFKNFKNSV